MAHFRSIATTCTALALLSGVMTSDCAGQWGPGQVRSFDTTWRFCAGQITGAERPEYDDASWTTVDLPHDWSIHGLAHPDAIVADATELPVVKGEWKFKKGDDTLWKNPHLDDGSWQTVTLPAPWEEHSNYTEDNVFGWFRRDLTVPADAQGKDIVINAGKIDDADETFFNGVKVGGLGHFPPEYATAWDVVRRYKVPHDIIHYGGKNSIAIRVFDGVGPGGIYDDGTPVAEGIFESTSPGGSGGGYINAGTGWYRKEFRLPGTVHGKRVFIEFDGVYMNSDVWLNGVHLGNRPYGYSSFRYELTQHLNYNGERNVLAVRARVQQPCSRWYSGAGIYRHVRLRIADPVHLAHWGTYVTTPEATEQEATVRVETKIQNQSGAPRQVVLETAVVDDAEVNVTHGSSTVTVQADGVIVVEQVFRVPHPHLWSPANPRLYHVTSSVFADGQRSDQSITPVGIRTFALTMDRGFFLNGKHVDIKGVCDHHDMGCLGTAVHTRAIERQLEILKGMGCNAIRTSHNPPDPALLDLCDRMGFLVMDEAFDEWKRLKTLYGYGQWFDEWSERDLTDMIHRDRNHPSIILWSIGNEIPEQGSADGYAISKRLSDICHKEDPTRPVTSACNTLDAAVRSGFVKPLDVVGINYQLSSYEKFHGKARLIASETASAVNTRGEYNLVPDGDSLTIRKELHNQCTAYDISAPNWGNTAESTLKAVRAAPWVAGEFVWTGFDYIGEPTPFPWPSASSYFGIVDLCGFPKDRYFLYQSQWTDKPMVHILPHWNWQGFEGRDIPVWCYSNCESVELFLNGKSLGEKKFSDTKDLHLLWKVPYAAGTLRAIAKTNGRAVCTDEVRTAGAPARIVLTPDHAEINADGDDLSNITIKIVDTDGLVCPNADNLVKFRIEGAGIIAGVGNGNPVSHEYFNAGERKAFHGLCLAVIQAKREKGHITLSAESEGLQAAQILIRAH